MSRPGVNMVPRTLVLLALIAAVLAEQEISYDEYPVVVPKRAALVLDRLMVALQRALQDEQISRPPKSLPVAAGLIQDEPFSNYEDQSPDLPPIAMDRKKYITTTRRSTAWKCYFNVVTCFRKK